VKSVRSRWKEKTLGLAIEVSRFDCAQHDTATEWFICNKSSALETPLGAWGSA